jgi:hypothetical protein
MATRLAAALAALAVGLTQAGTASAVGGHYTIVGGNDFERRQVQLALEVSSFDWSLIPRTITIRIEPIGQSRAGYGVIRLAAGRLDVGRTAWGVVQHEYAHQIDFFLLDAAKRAALTTFLGGEVWAPDDRGFVLPHAAYTGERFASAVAWTFWQDPDNSMAPGRNPDLPAGFDPGAFQMLLAGMGLAPPPAPFCRRVKILPGHWHRHRGGRRHLHPAVYARVCI